MQSTVGAGDTMAAALALGAERGLPEKEAFRLAMAAAAAACQCPGTQPPPRAAVDDLLDRVRIEPVP